MAIVQKLKSSEQWSSRAGDADHELSRSISRRRSRRVASQALASRSCAARRRWKSCGSFWVESVKKQPLMTIDVERFIDALYKTPKRAEIVGGAIVAFPPVCDEVGFASGEIAVSLHAQARKTGRGRASARMWAFSATCPTASHSVRTPPTPPAHGPGGSSFRRRRISPSRFAVRKIVGRLQNVACLKSEPTTSRLERR